MPLDFDPALFPRAYMPRMHAVSDADYGRLGLMTLSTKMLDRVFRDVPGVDKRGVWLRKTVVQRSDSSSARSEPTKGRRSFLLQLPQYSKATLVRFQSCRRIVETSNADNINDIILLLGHDAWILGYIHRWYGNIAAEAIANLRAVWMLPLAMGGHPRLGKESILNCVDSAVLGMIARLV